MVAYLSTNVGFKVVLPTDILSCEIEVTELISR